MSASVSICMLLVPFSCCFFWDFFSLLHSLHFADFMFARRQNKARMNEQKKNCYFYAVAFGILFPFIRIHSVLSSSFVRFILCSYLFCYIIIFLEFFFHRDFQLLFFFRYPTTCGFTLFLFFSYPDCFVQISCSSYVI